MTKLQGLMKIQIVCQFNTRQPECFLIPLVSPHLLSSPALILKNEISPDQWLSPFSSFPPQDLIVIGPRRR